MRPSTSTRPVRVSTLRAQQRRGDTGGASDDCSYPGHELSHLERFGEVVVGPSVDALDLVGPGAPRRQDDDRHAEPLAAPALEHREAVDPRQAQVQNDAIVVLSLALEQRILAVAPDIHDESGSTQRLAELLREGWLVFDHQQAHRRADSSPANLNTR